MAISARELRIGNWVMGDDGPQRVAYLGETIGLTNSIGGTDKYQQNPIISHDINNLQPIELSPEILEKAGFEKWDSGYWLNIEGDRSYLYNGDLYYFPFDCPNKSNADKLPPYLHWLQNHYFFTTGQELKIEL
jgi:hypothetical protein